MKESENILELRRIAKNWLEERGFDVPVGTSMVPAADVPEAVNALADLLARNSTQIQSKSIKTKEEALTWAARCTVNEPEVLAWSPLDSGIVQTVRWLNDNGFNTTDSGDGVSKLVAGWDPNEVLDFPHVFMHVPADSLVEEANRLRTLLTTEFGLAIEPGTLQASYDPSNGLGVLAMTTLNDTDLFDKS